MAELGDVGRRRTCYLASLKYAPGLAKEFALLGRRLAQHGWRVRYLLSSSYAWLLDDPAGETHYLARSETPRQVVCDTARFWRSGAAQVRRLFRQRAPDLLLVYNPHPCNVVLLRLAAHAQPDGLRAIYLHEPHVPDASSYGRRRALYIRVVDWVQAAALRRANCVILPSAHAQSLFSARYPHFRGEAHLAPILLPDCPAQGEAERRWVSLVGTLNHSRGTDDFLALVAHAAAAGERLRFKILTRSLVEGLDRLPVAARATLDVVRKDQISDDEIDETLAASIALFLPHKAAAQSGVVPVALRAGTPVLARDIPGLSQHVRHGENGYLYPIAPTPAQLLAGACYIRDHLAALSQQARQDYEETFSERNWARYYGWLAGAGSDRVWADG